MEALWVVSSGGNDGVADSSSSVVGVREKRDIVSE